MAIERRGGEEAGRRGWRRERDTGRGVETLEKGLRVKSPIEGTGACNSCTRRSVPRRVHVPAAACAPGWMQLPRITQRGRKWTRGPGRRIAPLVFPRERYPQPIDNESRTRKYRVSPPKTFITCWELDIREPR